MLSRQFQCHGCGWWTVAGEAELVRRLRKLGHFRRATDPPTEMVVELLNSYGPKLACDRCGATGLAITADDSGDRGEWEQAVVCELCREPIPAERLEVFPDARRCVACQDAADRGKSFVEPEYCPKCGAIVELRVSRGGGTTRYKMFCTGNPPCRL
ncbi:MAG: hypothetical protein CMJ58_05850 [Planctomycetaceae bacterium]|nr:hypothetical protein [Planctomycetaceae bacterium]